MEESDYYEEDGDVNRVCGRGQVTREKVQTDEYWWECDNACCLSAAEDKKKEPLLRTLYCRMKELFKWRWKKKKKSQAFGRLARSISVIKLFTTMLRRDGLLSLIFITPMFSAKMLFLLKVPLALRREKKWSACKRGVGERMSEFMAYLPSQWRACLKAMSVCSLYLRWWILGIVVLMDESHHFLLRVMVKGMTIWQMLNTTYSRRLMKSSFSTKKLLRVILQPFIRHFKVGC